MSRRKQCGEQEFGSDSFLDIIANIVGILIILIVIAGMKVARQPADIADTAADAVLADIAVSGSNAPLDDEGNALFPATDSTDDFTTAAEISEAPDFAGLDPFGENTDPFAVFESEPVDEPSGDTMLADATAEPGESTELTQQIASLKLEVENVGLEIDASQERLDLLMQQLEMRAVSSEQADTQLSELIAEQQDVIKQVETIEQELDRGEQRSLGIQATLTSLTDRQKYVTQALKQVSQETRRLQEVLNENAAPEVGEDRLQHRISPVSRDATDNELHFQLAGGKVAHIPLEQLLGRLKDQVSQRRNIVQKFYRSEGIVGPVGGFRMNYIVERQAVAPLQSLQYGGNAFRVVVSRWTILPAETLEAEAVDAAVRIGSRFRQVVESADPNTVLTIWLYPEDFSKFGPLRELAHRFNLRVAARPLPPGTPIAGSPSGSRSASQ